MSEIRKKLSDIQFKLLLNAQLRYNDSLQSFETAKGNLEQVKLLIFDALKIDWNIVTTIDPDNQELVFEEPDEE